MQRLDRERHADVPGVLQQRRQCPSRTCWRAPASPSSPSAGRRRSAPGSARRWRRPRPPHGCCRRARPGGQRRRRPETCRRGRGRSRSDPRPRISLPARSTPAGLHDVAPRRDGGDAGARAAIDELLQRPAFTVAELIASCARSFVKSRIRRRPRAPPSRARMRAPPAPDRRAGRRRRRAGTARRDARSSARSPGRRPW